MSVDIIRLANTLIDGWLKENELHASVIRGRIDGVQQLVNAIDEAVKAESNGNEKQHQESSGSEETVEVPFAPC